MGGHWPRVAKKCNALSLFNVNNTLLASRPGINNEAEDGDEGKVRGATGAILFYTQQAKSLALTCL